MTDTLVADDPTSTTRLHELRQQLDEARHVLVLTGAGCSADSGLPLFTGAGGLYADPRTVALSHVDQIPGSLPHLWQLWGGLRIKIRAAAPHTGHHALAQWTQDAAASGAQVTLATQNVDDLHERAGHTQVAHLHGRVDTTRCCRCSYARHGDWAQPVDVTCPGCGDLLRPGIVLFGERPDLEAEHAARQAVRRCEVFLAIGTSTAINTSTGLLRYAHDVQATTVLIDPTPDADPRYDFHLRGTAAQVLPRLLG